jgi:hypothetical protein
VNAIGEGPLSNVYKLQRGNAVPSLSLDVSKDGEFSGLTTGTGYNFYSIATEAGKTYALTLNDSGAGNGIATADVSVSIYTASGSWQASADSAWSTPLCFAGEEGTMYVRVESNANGSYALKYSEYTSAPASAPVVYHYNSTSYTPWGTSSAIRWNSVPGAANYKVYRATSAEGPWDNTTLKTTTTSIYYNSTDQTANTQYWFKVVASNSNGSKETVIQRWKPVTVGTPLESTFITSNEYQWFSFEAASDKTYTVKLDDGFHSGGSYTGFRGYIRFYNNSGSTVDGLSTSNYSNTWGTPKTISGYTGTVYLRINQNSGIGAYELEVTATP